MIFTIIVPIYNEEKTLLSVLKNLNNLKFKNFKKEVILVDDGSTDGTKKILQENKNLFDKLLTNPLSKGKGAAVKVALNNCNGDYVVFHDADLEYEPEDLLRFEDIFVKFDADGIIGSRFIYRHYTRSHNILNKFGNSLITTIFNLLYNTTFTDIFSCYFAFKRNLLNPVTLKKDGFEQHAELLTKVIKKGSKFYEVPISYNGRSVEEGKKIKFYHIFPILFQIIIGKFR